MDAKLINPFLDSVKSVLEQFGISSIKIDGIKKEKKYVETEIVSIIGLVGDVKGNIAYSMTQDTAKRIVSNMMMGMPVDVMDEMAVSAFGELTNMFTGNASALLFQNGYSIDITPPSTILGKEVHVNISKTNFISVSMDTSAGGIEVSIGLKE